MLRICYLILTMILSLSLFAQTNVLSGDYQSSLTIPVEEESEYQAYRLDFSSSSSKFTEPSCSRVGMAESSFYFDFTVPESGVATVSVEFDVPGFFGISLYKEVNNEFIELACHSYRSKQGMLILDDESLYLENENILARIWLPEVGQQEIINIDIKPNHIEHAPDKSAISVLPDAYTPEELVLDILISGCVEAQNIQYTGHNNAIGYFTNGIPGLDFEEGIIMSSGNVVDAMGPNTGNASTNLNQPGDPDLQSIVGANTNDAAILEFEFIPATDVVEFRYVWASDEYPTWANSSYNDVFAFFISGGPENYNLQNIALLPGTTTPVSINNVNYGSSHNGPCQNCEYYIVNDGSPYIMYDGMTVTLSAIAAVTPCETYQMKLGVADVVDGILDSAVFLEAGSFFSGASVSAENISDVGESNDIWEGCSNTYEISLVEGADNSEDIVIDVEIDHANSTAVEGVDFTPFPTELTIPAGETSVQFDYTAFELDDEDGDIFFIVSFFTSCPCGNIPADPIVDTVWIYNFEFVKGGIQDLQTLYCGTDAPEEIELEGRTNLDPEISFHWCNGQSGPNSTFNTEFGETTYYLTMADVCGNELYDSVTIRISDIIVDNTQVTHPSCNNACDGRFDIEMEGSFEPFVYRYANENWVSWPDSVHVTSLNTFTGLCPANYKLTVTDAIGCFHRLDFSIPNPPPVSQAPGLLDNDMRFCEDPGEITLTAASNQPNPIYQWNTGATTSSITITPNTGVNTYWVRLFDGCGNFKEDELEIKYSDIEVDFDLTADSGDCDGSASAFASNGIWPYSYFWEAPLSSFDFAQENLCAGTYYLQVSDANNCEKYIEVVIEEYNFVDQGKYDHIFTIYPNPSQGNFIIDYSKMDISDVHVKITDVNGRLVENFILNSETKSVSGIQAGVYFVELIKNDAIVGVQKLVITE